MLYVQSRKQTNLDTLSLAIVLDQRSYPSATARLLRERHAIQYSLISPYTRRHLKPSLLRAEPCGRLVALRKRRWPRKACPQKENDFRRRSVSISALLL